MVYYSFDFVSKVTCLCMNEIRSRGLKEPKLFCKSMPNSALFAKVFDKLECTEEDILQTDIHTVATLMQDVLWKSNERILSKKIWKNINYETCVLSSLSNFIDSKSEGFLIEILDFLVEVLCKKQYNHLSAYRLGDALGKVVLGAADCDPILSEKAGHFLTRMIIEHAKVKHRQRMHTQKQKVSRTFYRIDSGYEDAHASYSCHSFYSECRPLDKTASTLARAKHYNRATAKIQRVHSDWLDYANDIQSMMDATSCSLPTDSSQEGAWISIFTDFELLVEFQKDMNCASPLLYRILWEASKPTLAEATDPFTRSYLFHHSKAFCAEGQLKEAFDEFADVRSRTEQLMETYDVKPKATPFGKLNHSFNHIKNNFRKSISKLDTTMVDDTNREIPPQKPISMKNVVKKIMKIKSTDGQKKRKSALITFASEGSSAVAL